jgi:hypothetical protein
MRKYGQLVPLSEQNLVDCTGDYSNAGCDGGWPNNAFAFAADNIKQGSTSTLRKYGLDTETGYPYVEKVRSRKYGYIYPVIADRLMPLLETVRREHQRRLHRREAQHRRWTHGSGGEYRTSQRVHRCNGIGVLSIRWYKRR